MRMGKLAVVRGSSGQSLVETVLITPLLLILVLNAVNFGYFFLVTLNLTAAPRSGVEYSIQGFDTPSAISLPLAGPPTPCGVGNTAGCLSVSYLTYRDMTGALNNPTGASLQVCSPTNLNSSKSGVNGTGVNQVANCVTCSGSSCGSVGAGSGVGTPPAHADPEAPSFVLNRVDVTYTFTPLIPGTPFNIVVLAACGGPGTSCTFSRHAEMRVMN